MTTAVGSLGPVSRLARWPGWSRPVPASIAYVLLGATLSYVAITIAIVCAYDGSLAQTWARGAHPFTRCIAFWIPGGLLLALSLHERPRPWREWLRPALWAALYASGVAVLVFLAQLHYVNRVAGGFYDVPSDQTLWITHVQRANPVVLWASLSTLLFASIGMLRAGGARALQRSALAWAPSMRRALWPLDARRLGWLLWGAAPGALLGSALFASIALLAAGVVLVFAPSRWTVRTQRAARAAARGLDSLAEWLGRPNAPQLDWPEHELTTAITGAAFGLLATAALGAVAPASILALALIGGALLAWKGVSSRAALVLVGLFGGALTLWLTETAHADDGTWPEGSSVSDLMATGGGPESVDYARDLAESAAEGANSGGLGGELAGEEDAEVRPFELDRLFEPPPAENEPRDEESEPGDEASTDRPRPVIDLPLGRPEPGDSGSGEGGTER